MARSESGATFNSTGSLKAGAPGSRVTFFAPPNVSDRRLPATISALLPANPTLAAPISTGLLPNSFESLILTLLPPMLTRTTCRTVWFEKLAGMAPRGGCGLGVQVPTQLPTQFCASAERFAWTPRAATTIARRTARFENMVPSTIVQWWRLTRLARLGYAHSVTPTTGQPRLHCSQGLASVIVLLLGIQQP